MVGRDITNCWLEDKNREWKALIKLLHIDFVREEGSLKLTIWLTSKYRSMCNESGRFRISYAQSLK